ncbi:MAG: hypothetical protein H8E29_09025 [Anaerolineales bacterium]|uniref:Uncharacterized protein n=1 Tax=Candidatus Desulfolinea nitratireducens TaxID=2841698 RepID=A0A8J6NGR1_9CHLR|nr:hypothetical protein [Candidatus Desulfolinea nitratireducens]
MTSFLDYMLSKHFTAKLAKCDCGIMMGVAMTVSELSDNSNLVKGQGNKNITEN